MSPGKKPIPILKRPVQLVGRFAESTNEVGRGRASGTKNVAVRSFAPVPKGKLNQFM